MNITEYKLILTYEGTVMQKELIYRGNENILVIDHTQRPFVHDKDDQHAIRITISRHILEKFLEIIK